MTAESLAEKSKTFAELLDALQGSKAEGTPARAVESCRTRLKVERCRQINNK